MTVDWKHLDQAQKRARILGVAGELFAREGVDFPMPSLAKEVGVGVGSLYRQIGSKDDVIAELVIDRLQRFQAMFDAADVSGDPATTLFAVVDAVLAETMQDRVAKMSFELALDRPEVDEARTQAAVSLARLVDAAKADGGIRSDATVMDLRMLFRLGREAEKITPGGGARIAQLVVAGLRSA